MPLGANPTRISRYEIKGLIAQGGMGHLYLAWDPNTNRLVVLKLLDATLDSRELRERFEREARALASLNHPTIVHIYDYGDFQDAPFIVMEYVRGETLAEKIRRKAPISVAQTLKLMAELCAGLAHAHGAGVIHRDVKPANLMVDSDERLKILDFGIARVAGSNITRIGSLQSMMTQPSMRIGTPGYMSPEQTRGADIDHRTDIFAVGAVCYELLSKREAFSGATIQEIETNVVAAQPVPLASLVPGLDPEIGTIVSRALAKDRDQRYRDATAIGEAFEGCLVRLARPNTPLPVRRPMPAPQNSGSKSAASRAEAAYQRSLAASEEGARDASRRFAVEALAEDPEHAGARALLSRLAPERRPVPLPTQGRPTSTDQTVLISRPKVGPRVTSTDPTVLISRANRPAGVTVSDPTVLISRPAAAPRVTSTDETVLMKRAEQPAPALRKRYEHLWAGLPPLWLRSKATWTRWRSQWARRQPSKPNVQSTRGRGAAVASHSGRWALVGVAILVFVAGTALIAIWLSRPSGQLLTITKPVGGTISSSGITCGTRGSDCSTRRPNGDGVELEAVADAGFVFSAFIGDCAPIGRTVMTVAHTCGAKFDPVATPYEKRVWSLTITPPKGGSILAAGDVLCGALGSKCSADLPDGVPVTLRMQPEDGHTFVSYTGDCAPNGDTMMSGPRTCGATFTETPKDKTGPVPIKTPTGPTRRPIQHDGPPVASTPLSPALPVSPGPPPGPPPPVPPVKSDEAPPTLGGGEVKRAETQEEHSRAEIPERLKEYCAALSTLDPVKIQAAYPKVDMSSVSEMKRQYKSNRCTLTGAPEFDKIDAAAGTAQVQIGMKQVQVMQSGGGPKTNETIANVTLSRPRPDTAWRIDVVRQETKPKP